MWLSVFRSLRSLRPTPFFNQHANTFSNEATLEGSSNQSNVNKLDENILNIVVCPLTKKKLRYDEERQLLINDELGIGFKINNGIPNMVPSDAIKV